ncbi:MAG: DUF4339 domain-containing protein [Treponema sp.]|nr:DUF4339 domain-containing protein [Treponema sp.]
MLNKKHETTAWLTSIYYKEYGPFTPDELAQRAAKREFGWNMYVYRFPKDNVWRPARDIPEIREILLKHFPLREGDEGPSGGLVFKDKKSKLIEVSPADAGYCIWENAEKACKNFSFNGFGGWRFPGKDELSCVSGYISNQIREERKITQTNEFILHWSNERNGDKATAVYTCIVEDKWEPLKNKPADGTDSGHYINKDGILRGKDKQLPVTEWHLVRPVRDLNI